MSWRNKVPWKDRIVHNQTKFQHPTKCGWWDIASQIWRLLCNSHWSKWPKTFCGRCIHGYACYGLISNPTCHISFNQLTQLSIHNWYFLTKWASVSYLFPFVYGAIIVWIRWKCHLYIHPLTFGVFIQVQYCHVESWRKACHFADVVFMYICEWEIYSNCECVNIGSGNAIVPIRRRPNTCADVG